MGIGSGRKGKGKFKRAKSGVGGEVGAEGNAREEARERPRANVGEICRGKGKGRENMYGKGGKERGIWVTEERN